MKLDIRWTARVEQAARYYRPKMDSCSTDYVIPNEAHDGDIMVAPMTEHFKGGFELEQLPRAAAKYFRGGTIHS